MQDSVVPSSRKVSKRPIAARMRSAPSLTAVPEGDDIIPPVSLRAPKLGVLILFSVFLMAAVNEVWSTYQHMFVHVALETHQSGEDDEDVVQVKPVRLRRKKRDEVNSTEFEFHGELPLTLRYLANTEEPILPSDRALFWHVPRSGGSTVKTIVSHCFRLTIASEAGGGAASNELKIIHDLEGGKYLNVDTVTVTGIHRAQQLNLAAYPDLNLISTPYLHDASDKLFSDQHRGRLFTMLRHPIERAASLFYLLSSNPKNTYMEPGMTLTEYAKSDLVENNWMTRFLSNTTEGEVTAKHEALAKEVLRTKCLVGLLREKGASLQRFEAYFGWSIDGERTADCHQKVMDWSWPNKNKHPPIKEGNEAWDILLKNNVFDLRVYEFAEQLFREQSRFFLLNTTTEHDDGNG